MFKRTGDFAAGQFVFNTLDKIPLVRWVVILLRKLPLIAPLFFYFEQLTLRRGFYFFSTLNSFINGCVSLSNLVFTPKLKNVDPQSLHYDGRVTILVPARNEVSNLPNLISCLKKQVGVPDLKVLIVDDNSTDRTAEVGREVIGDDPRFEILSIYTPPIAGWLGKPAALEAGRIHLENSGEHPGLLMLIDADVLIEPEGIVRAAVSYRDSIADLVTIWPQQRQHGIVEHLFQPMFTWLWMAWAPRWWGNTVMPKLPFMTVTMGQFMIISWEHYQAVGGHYAVKSNPMEDLTFGRVLRRKGYRTDVVFGGDYVHCRMYASWKEIRDGYTRWLYIFLPSGSFSFFGPAMTLLHFVAPSWLLFRNVRKPGIIAYVSVVASRLFVNFANGGGESVMKFISALLHPFTAVGTVYLLCRSHWLARHNQIVWKDRIISEHGSQELKDAS